MLREGRKWQCCVLCLYRKQQEASWRKEEEEMVQPEEPLGCDSGDEQCKALSYPCSREGVQKEIEGLVEGNLATISPLLMKTDQEGNSSYVGRRGSLF